MLGPVVGRSLLVVFAVEFVVGGSTTDVAVAAVVLAVVVVDNVVDDATD